VENISGSNLEIGKLYTIERELTLLKIDTRNYLPHGWYVVTRAKRNPVGFLVLDQFLKDQAYFQKVLLPDRVCMVCLINGVAKEIC
jgi:hypothetical protein